METILQNIWEFLKSIPYGIMHYADLFHGNLRDRIGGWVMLAIIGILILWLIKIQYFPELSLKITLPKRKSKQS